jgi:DNA-binding MarR family transcriptional regulator
MNNSAENYLFKPSERMRNLQFLEEIEQNPKVSQRELSNKFGIALGVTNACIKRMARRGLIRLKGIPPRRIAYYITPKGFAEKANLALRFFSYNIRHYAEMKKLISRKLLEMQQGGVKRVVFYGVSDEMEIAYVILQGTDMELVAIVDGDDGVRPQTVLGRKAENPVIIENLKADAILITSIRAKDEILRNAKRIMRRNNKIKLFTIT